VSDSTGTATGPSGSDGAERSSGTRDGGGSTRIGREGSSGRSGPLGGLLGAPGRLLLRIVTFYKQVVAELRKVIWPTRKELLTYTSVVLVFVVVMVAVVSVFDLAFTQSVIHVFGE
jgi:preprotein translocase subunit SecE